jgi:glucose/arabinose dehydrogenase
MNCRPSSIRPLRCLIAILIGAVLVASASFLGDPAAQAAVPGGFTDSVVASIGQPTDIAFTPAGTMLVTSQGGVLYKRSGGSTSAVLNLSNRICSDFERGLLGVTVDPAFTSNSYIYLFYTFNKHNTCVDNSPSSPVNRVSRWTFQGSTVANETVLVDNMPSPNGNHNAGGMTFGKDGYLYITIGDGGCEIGSPSECAGANDNARVKNRLQGKILRVSRNGIAPSSNPFYDEGGTCRLTGSTSAGKHCRETFAWGFRNPFRVAADPNASSTRIFVNDVGQGAWEEIDQLSAGKDYGWNFCEGFHATGSSALCGFSDTNPIFEYGHGACNSITGGAFIPNGVWPSTYTGTYFFADYTCGTIWTMKNSGGTWSRSTFASGLGAVTELEFGPSGSNIALYYANYGSSQIRRISYNNADNDAPTAEIDASPTYGALPLTVHFDGRDSSDPDGDTLSYRWDFGDGTSSTQSQFNKTYTAKKKYQVTLTVSDGKGGIDTDAVRIDAGNTRPTAEITSPYASTEFAVGQTITLTGKGLDAEDGTLSSSRMSWEVRLHHDTHTHPYLSRTTGNNLTFTAPAPEDLLAAGNSYLEIRLTVRDSGGLGKLVKMNLYPNKVNVTVGSNVPGMLLWIEGTPFTAPATVLTWENNPLRIVAPDQVGPDGQPYLYDFWSDGGRRSHDYDTPANDAQVNATFFVMPGDIFAAHADARVSQSYPTRNEGRGTGLSAKDGAGNDYETVIRFKLSGVGDKVYRARLFLWAYDPTSDGPAIYETSPHWQETGVTWNNRPGPIGGQLDNYGPIADNSWVAYDVESAIDGDGYVAFVIRGTSSDAVSWYSRQAASRQPRLVIWSSEVSASVDEPSGTPTPSPTLEPSVTVTPVPTEIGEKPTAEPTVEAGSPVPQPTLDSGSPTAVPEPVDPVPFADEFEGDLSGWLGEGATLAAGAGRDGSQGVRLASIGNDNQPGAASYVRRPLDPAETSVHVAFDVLPIALDPNATRLATITGVNNTPIASLYLLADGTLGVRLADGDSLTTVGALDLTNWSRIEMALSQTTESATIDVWINGSFAGGAQLTGTWSAPQSALLGGWATDRTYDLLIDNLVIDRMCISGCPEGPIDPIPTSTPDAVAGEPDPATPVSG